MNYIVVMLTRLNVFFIKQKTAYEMRISDSSSDVFSSDLDEAIAKVIMDIFNHLPPGSKGGVKNGFKYQWANGIIHGMNANPGLGGIIKPKSKKQVTQIGRASCRERVCQYV